MSDPAADVRELLPRALRFIADIILARVDDKGTHGWLMMAAGEIESLRDEVVRLKGIVPAPPMDYPDLLPPATVTPFCAERDRQERSRPCPTCGGMGKA